MSIVSLDNLILTIRGEKVILDAELVPPRKPIGFQVKPAEGP